MHRSSEDPTQKLKKFGQTMAVCFFILFAIFWWRHKSIAPYFLALSVFFEISALFMARTLIPIEKMWMKFGHVLGWINLRIILSFVYYLILTPIRLILVLLGKDLLNQAVCKERASYWQARDKSDISSGSYEKMY